MNFFFHHVLSFSVSDKLVNDLQSQMTTHEHRIDLLQKENDSLKSSLEKFLISKEQSYRQNSHTNETVRSIHYTFFLI